MKNVAKTLPRIVETATFPGQDPVFSRFGLFPLNGPGGLRRQIQQDAIDAFHLVGDAACDVVQQGIGDLFNGGGHGVGGVHRPDDGGPAFVPLAVPHAHALHVGHGDEILPHLAGQTVLVEFLPQNAVSFPQGLQTVPGDSAETPDTQAGAGEGLSVDHAVGQAQGFAHNTDLVLE